MEPYEYKTLFDFETSYWWYRGIRAIILDTLERLDLGPSPCILDTGCGTGKNLESIREKITPYSFGFDISPYAAKYWPKRGLKHMCLASINEIPFREESFDAVYSQSSLLHIAKREFLQTLKGLLKVLKKGGVLYFNVKFGEGETFLADKRYGNVKKFFSFFSKEEIEKLVKKLDVELLSISIRKDISSYDTNDLIYVYLKKLR